VGGDSIGTKFVGDSEGGCWTSLDEGSVARATGMTGGVGCGGRTRDVYFGCVPTEAAKMDEVVLVYPRLEVTNLGMRGRVGDEAVDRSPFEVSVGEHSRRSSSVDMG